MHFETRVFNGQFSSTGDFYYCSCQSEIRVYDTSNIFDWRLTSEIPGFNIQWTITDLDLSPCENYLVYTTIDSHITLVNIREDLSNPYNFQCEGHQLPLETGRDHIGYAIWSAKFSGSGNEVVAGTSNDSIVIYDLVSKTTSYEIPNAHKEDINSVCFANRDESQVVFTGSDDSLIKIWDKRDLQRKPQGVLLGHREGITHISSKGDGIHLISNSKDQTLKLWDIRTMCSSSEASRFQKENRYQTHFDYRWEDYPLRNYKKRLAADESLMTFRGHEILFTLIRCYFSPLFTTGQRFIYTGSSSKKVLIYDSYTGKKVTSLKPLIPLQQCVIRDVSWHPYLPLIASTASSNTIHIYSR